VRQIHHSLTLPQLHVMVAILNDALLAVGTDIFSQPVFAESNVSFEHGAGRLYWGGRNLLENR
jgi:hypothetical protein